MSTLVGQTIGGYSVLASIGSGGMRAVYRGVHKRLGRPVAIKTLHVGAQEGRQAERFLAEARLQGALRHPGIATLYDFLEQNGHAYIIMEFVDGQTLAEFLQSHGPLAERKALEILHQVGEAVRYLHGQGIVHRDIKPANIKVAPDGTTKLLEFGIARSLRSARPGEALTTPPLLVGNFEYLAPECFEGKQGDERSDVWSLGVLLYEMLTGRLPFEGGSISELCRRVKSGTYTPPSRFNAHISPRVESLLRRCLGKSGSDRFSSIDALLRQVNAHLNGSRALLPKAFLGPLSYRNLWIFASAIVAVLALTFTDKAASFTGSNTPVIEVKTINIDVVNGPAEVFSDGRDLGTTPIQIEKPTGQHVSVLLRREGFVNLPVDFNVDERSSYSYVLQQAKQ